jgi:hypothetical protein
VLEATIRGSRGFAAVTAARAAEVEAAIPERLVSRKFGVGELVLQIRRLARGDVAVRERLVDLGVYSAFRAARKPSFRAATVMPRFAATVFVWLVFFAKSRSSSTTRIRCSTPLLPLAFMRQTCHDFL